MIYCAFFDELFWALLCAGRGERQRRSNEDSALYGVSSPPASSPIKGATGIAGLHISPRRMFGQNILCDGTLRRQPRAPPSPVAKMFFKVC